MRRLMNSRCECSDGIRCHYPDTNCLLIPGVIWMLNVQLLCAATLVALNSSPPLMV